MGLPSSRRIRRTIGAAVALVLVAGAVVLTGVADADDDDPSAAVHAAALSAATVDYPAPFTCAIARANIFATQFHPEKSQRAGLSLLANFVTWDGCP